MSYPKNTILRYYPIDSVAHYTGIVLANGILQVKPVQQSFSSLSDWLATLPEQPSEDKLEMTVKPAPLHWNVTRPVYSLRNMMSWPQYLYKIIVRSNKYLKNNMELCAAFNHLVDVLDTYKTRFMIMASTITRHSFYNEILLHYPHPHRPPQKWALLPVSFYRVDRHHTWLDSVEYKKEFAPNVYEAYRPLYDLMEQYGVIDYVKRANQQAELHRLHKRLQEGEKDLFRLEYKQKNLQVLLECQRRYVEQIKDNIQELKK